MNKPDYQKIACELILNDRQPVKPVTKPTPLNFNPLLRVMFDMAGVPAPLADGYEAYLVAQEEKMQLEYEAAINDLGDDTLPGVSTLANL
jgi:hypothetical protein